MANKKKDDKLLFDPYILAERLESLRKDDENSNSNSLTLVQLEKDIFAKTGVSISGQQLGTYERGDSGQRPNINNLLALEKYYGVSIDYLIGRTKIKNKNATDKYTEKKFGLSPESMYVLKQIHSRKLDRRGALSSDIINSILENTNFWENFDITFPEYIAAKYIYRTSDFDIDVVRYFLLKLLEKLIDDIADKVSLQEALPVGE